MPCTVAGRRVCGCVYVLTKGRARSRAWVQTFSVNPQVTEPCQLFSGADLSCVVQESSAFLLLCQLFLENYCLILIPFVSLVVLYIHKFWNGSCGSHLLLSLSTVACPLRRLRGSMRMNMWLSHALGGRFKAPPTGVTLHLKCDLKCRHWPQRMTLCNSSKWLGSSNDG